MFLNIKVLNWKYFIENETSEIKPNEMKWNGKRNETKAETKPMKTLSLFTSVFTKITSKPFLSFSIYLVFICLFEYIYIYIYIFFFLYR